MLKSITVRALVILAVFLAAACLPVQPTRAEGAAKTCMSGPNAAAPRGMHWYYHRDRKADRLCWYLGPLGERAHARRAASEKSTASPPPVMRPAEDRAAVAGTREAAMREAEAAFIAGPAAASLALEKPAATDERATLGRALGLSITPSDMAGDETKSSSAQ